MNLPASMPCAEKNPIRPVYAYTSPQISVCRLRFCWDFAAQDFPDAAGRIDFFQLVVTSFCIECPVGSLALAAVPRHPDPGFLEPKSRECNGQELIEYMAAGIY